jgi:hypothetical protein
MSFEQAGFPEFVKDFGLTSRALGPQVAGLFDQHIRGVLFDYLKKLGEGFENHGEIEF